MPLFRVTAGAEDQPKRADCKGMASAWAARQSARLAGGDALYSSVPRWNLIAALIAPAATQRPRAAPTH